jgi:hypothetical protein
MPRGICMLHASRSLPRKFYRIDGFGNVNGFTIDIARASAAPGLEHRCRAEIGRLSRLRTLQSATRLGGEALLRPPAML